MMTKAELILDLINQQQSKIKELQTFLQSLNESLLNEQKSSAGDKHEVSRSMVHLEQEKIAHQLVLLKEQLTLLLEIKEIGGSTSIRRGSLIHLEGLMLLLGVALGQTKVKDSQVISIGMSAPIVKVLITKKIGDEIDLMNEKRKIIAID